MQKTTGNKGLDIHTAFMWGIFCLAVIVPLALLVVLSVKTSAESPFDRLSISLRGDGFKTEIVCTQSSDGKWYFFMPSCAAHCKGYISCDSDVTLTANGACYKNGDEFPVSGEVLTVTATDKKEIRDIALMFSQNAGGVFITTQSGSIEHINSDKNYKEAGKAVVVRCDGRVDYSGELDYIKSRGNSTWAEKKKPYQISLAKASGILGMEQGEKWVLLANALDNSNIRNKLVLDAAAKAQLDFSPQSEYADLYINGRYAGLYLVSQKVEVSQASVDINDLEDATKKVNPLNLELYEPVFGTLDNRTSYKCTSVSENPQDISGGYLLKLELDERYVEETSGFITGQKQPVVLDSPKYASEEQTRYIAAFVQEFEDALYAADGINPTTGKHYYEYIDMDSWVLKYLVEEVFQNYDCGVTSQYFYKDSNDDVMYAGPAWDYDLSAGNYGAPVNFLVGSVEIHGEGVYNRWFSHLYAMPEFYKRTVELYGQIFAPMLEALQAEGLDKYINITSAATYMDRTLYGLSIEKYESDKQALRDYITQRKSFLDSIWTAGDTYYTLFIDTKEWSNRYIYYSIKEGECPPDLGNNDSIANGWFYLGTDEPYDSSIPMTEDIGIYSKLSFEDYYNMLEGKETIEADG